MSAKLHHTLWQISAVAATTAAAGYPASNVSTPGVRKPWRSTAITNPQDLDVDLGTIRANVVICIQHANAASCVISYGSVAYTTTNAGTQTLTMDRHGRRKHSLALVGSVRYIRFSFGAVAPDDSAAYFEVGAVYPFSTTLALPEDPLLGSEANPRLPQTLIELANGNTFAIDRGAARQRLTLRYRGLRTVDLDEAARRARAGACWLDLDVTANRELQWPVRHVDDQLQRTLARASQDEAAHALLEVA